MIDTAKKAFPGKKIIVSSITPRDDNLDGNVRIINQAVERKISKFNDVIHVHNNDLRDRSFYHDCKHLNRNRGVRMFASNIKRGIRVANGTTNNKSRYLSRHSDVQIPIRPDYSDDSDSVPYRSAHYQSMGSSILKPEGSVGCQYGVDTQSNEVNQEKEAKKEKGINNILSQLSSLNKLVNVFVPSNLQQGSMMYPQSAVPLPCFPYYSSTFAQTARS